MNEKLYVGNLSYQTTAEDLRQLFAQAGNVSACDLIMDRDTGQSKGFAFVTMASQAEAEKATSMFNAHSFGDRPLTVNTATFTNQGTLQAQEGDNLTLTGTTWTNQGIAEADSGSVITISGSVTLS